MTRTFAHEFSPEGANPVTGPRVELTVQEIEDAGLREVLQTPGAGIGSWSFLGDLLQPGDPFVFHQPLGQSREVKVALSGLFGRFFARAYLERYFHLSVFHHLGQEPISLNAPREISITAREEGDLPDWVACTNTFSDLTLAEAKGTHDKAGPISALSRAWNQVRRVDVVERGRTVPAKRIAIATRWGVAAGEPGEPRIAAHDPADEGGAHRTRAERCHVRGALPPSHRKHDLATWPSRACQRSSRPDKRRRSVGRRSGNRSCPTATPREFRETDGFAR